MIAEQRCISRAQVGFFDAHCDTVMKVMDGSLDFQSGAGTGHVSLPDLVSAGSRAQVFACFVLSDRHPGTERETAEMVIATIHDMIDGTGGAMGIALTGSDLRAACTGGPIAGLVAMEGADPLEGEATALEHFWHLGVRVVIPAWKDNPFSGTAFGTNSSLTGRGEELVRVAEDLGTVVDVSHLSDRAFADVCQVARRPFIASHSNCRALCPHPRNLTDHMIRELSDRGGVMGINLHTGFLDPERCVEEGRFARELASRGQTGDEADDLRRQFAANLPRVSPEWVARHVLHAIGVGGEDCVGLGGDLDGTDYLPVGIDGVKDYPKLAPLLLEEGLTSRQLEKVAWRNFERVFCEVLPN